jgi:hypothetical protein
MQSSYGGSRGFKVGSMAFLLLAVLLAVFSGDILLVFAVGTAIAGVVLLGPHLNSSADRQADSRSISSSVPAPTSAPRPTPARVPSLAPRPSRANLARLAIHKSRMAVRPSLGRSTASRPRTRATNSAVADPPSQAPVIQVLQ